MRKKASRITGALLGTLFSRPKRYIGRRFGCYTIIGFAGEGRYGSCYSAVSDSENNVIIKRFKPRIFAKNGSRNEYEAVILSQLNDDRFPELLGVINQDGFYAFVLEEKPGKTFEELLFRDNRTLSGKEFYSFGLQLIQIARHLHEQGIVHRDIRIPNIIVDESGSISLVDFGLARYAGNEGCKYCQDYSYLGDVLLYLLYSSFQREEGKRSRPWYIELTLSENQMLLLKRLMGLERIYESIEDIEDDFRAAFG
ncbi:MAG TPA: protein kinase family protein [Clostridiaceae bacterium]|nr:protein kinase family protein [Clostridiaceae bacterium]